MDNATRLAAWISGTLLAIGLGTAPAPAQAASRSHDVHVVSTDNSCVNQKAVYQFKLANLGEQYRRGVRGRIVWRGQGYSETFSRRVRRGDLTTERIAVAPDLEAVLTLRSQGHVLLRARMTGYCHKVSPGVG